MQYFLQLRDSMEQEPDFRAPLQFCMRFVDQALVGPHFPFGRPRQEFNCAVLHTSSRGVLSRDYFKVFNTDHNRADHVTSWLL